MTPTPTPVPFNDFIRAIDYAISRSEGMTLQQMVFIAVCLALIVLGIYGIALIRRPKQPKVEVVTIEALSQTITDERQDKADLKAMLLQQSQQHVESLSAISDNMNRHNDQDERRDATTEKVVDYIGDLQITQKQQVRLLTNMNTAIVSIQEHGSGPVQLLRDVVDDMYEHGTKATQEGVTIIRRELDELKQLVKDGDEHLCAKVDELERSIQNCLELKTEPAPVLLLPDEPKAGAA